MVLSGRKRRVEDDDEPLVPACDNDRRSKLTSYPDGVVIHRAIRPLIDPLHRMIRYMKTEIRNFDDAFEDICRLGSQYPDVPVDKDPGRTPRTLPNCGTTADLSDVVDASEIQPQTLVNTNANVEVLDFGRGAMDDEKVKRKRLLLEENDDAESVGRGSVGAKNSHHKKKSGTRRLDDRDDGHKDEGEVQVIASSSAVPMSDRAGVKRSFGAARNPFLGLHGMHYRPGERLRYIQDEGDFKLPCSHIIDGDISPTPPLFSVTGNLMDFFHMKCDLITFLRDLLDKDETIRKEAVSTPINAYHIATNLCSEVNPRLATIVNGSHSFLDVAETTNGTRRWWRISCDGVMSTAENIIDNLTRGTQSTSPRIRIGGDAKGHFLEVIEPQYFILRYPGTVAALLDRDIEDITDLDDGNNPPPIRVYMTE